MEDDLFDSLLDLEEQYYNEGFQLGTADGTRAGHVEGRLFGLEKGFEKYLEMGRLQGRSVVWTDRLPISQVGGTDVEDPENPGRTANNVISSVPEPINGTICIGENTVSGPEATGNCRLPQLPRNARLVKHINALQALTEPESLSVQNSEDSVSDFDDRLKRAQGKAKIIEKLVGEEQKHELVDGIHSRSGGTVHSRSIDRGEGNNIEDTNILNARH